MKTMFVYFPGRPLQDIIIDMKLIVDKWTDEVHFFSRIKFVVL